MSLANPFFSIVIPAYNRAYILPQTIESIKKQTFTDYEIIVVDDGSKDNTKEVLEALDLPQLKYVYQNNAERSAARNNGVSNALGQYVCFLDSDDFYLENHLQVLYHEIANNGFDKAMYFVECNHLQKGVISTPALQKIETDLYTYFFAHSVVPARVCIEKSIFEEFKFDVKTVIVEDTVLWCNIATKYPIHHIHQNTVLYHLHDDNSVLIEKNCFLPRLQGLERMFEDHKMRRLVPKQSRLDVLSACYFGIARHYELMKKFWPMLINLIKSISLTPISPTTKKKIYMIYAYLLGKPSNNF
jgi:glycosyltransferase involved in cell wall biosynthesis